MEDTKMAPTTQPLEKGTAKLKKTKKARVDKKLQTDRKKAMHDIAALRLRNTIRHWPKRGTLSDKIDRPMAQKAGTYASMVQNLIEVIVDAGDKDKDFAMVVGDLTLVLVKLEQTASGRGVQRCGGGQNKPEEVKEDQGVQTSGNVEEQSDEILWDE